MDWVRLVVLFSSIFWLRFSHAELSRVFIHCCNLGRNYGRTNTQCEDYPIPVSGVQKQDQYWCSVALGVCCKEEVTIGKCDDGKLAAQESQDCAVESGSPGEEEFKQCCDCCQLGLLAGSSGYGEQCDEAGFQIVQCNKLYKECCEFSKTRKGLFNLNHTDGSPERDNEIPRAEETIAPRFESTSPTPCPDANPDDPYAPPCLIPGPVFIEPLPSANRVVTQSCPPGLEYHVGNGECLDINECNRGVHNCHAGQKCINVIGSFKCVNLDAEPERPPVVPGQSECRRGYQWEQRSGSCEDIDECATGNDNCGVGMRCENEAGTFRCTREISCGTGYTYDAGRRECIDNDECSLGNHNCGLAYDCVNTQGSFRCTAKTCPKKMRVNYQNGQCEHVDCPTGFEASDEGVCIDTNECSTPSTCRRNQECFNTVGSFLCRDMLNCGAGYLLNEDGSRCNDVDECSEGTHTCVGGQLCENRPGTFVCNCQEGFEFGAYTKHCEDIDECSRFGTSACPSSADCQNFPGSFRCNCKEGFRPGQEGQHCLDIDECEEHNPCQHGCINSWGGYNCTCKTGYRLAPDGRSCDDIDECVEQAHNQLCFGSCVNVPGGYNCTCPSGFRMMENGRNCQDIDECKENNYCDRDDQICTNTEGGYQCHTIRCPAGYIQDPVQKNRCRRASLVCAIGDFNCLQQPISYSYNYMGIPSSQALPTTGRIDLFTMRGPQQAATNVEFNLIVKEARPLLAGVRPANRRVFDVKTTGFNQATISLVAQLDGPQEITLEMQMSMNTNGVFSGKAVANIVITVTKTRPDSLRI